MKRLFFAVFGLHALIALAACSESGGPTTPGGSLELSGTWAAASGDGGRFGAVTFQADTSDISRDMLSEGASIVVELHEDGTTSGRLFVPSGTEGVPDLDVDLTGTWREEGGIVRLDHAADTFLRDLPFAIEGNRLVADDRVGGVRVRVTLESVSSEVLGDVSSDLGEFLVAAVVDVMESFPVQLAGAMTFRNLGPETRTLVTGVCWPLLRAYRPGEDTPVWDQLEEGACALFTTRLDVVAPGDSVRFETPVASAADVLDDELPDGTYRITVYFSTVPDGEIELEAGEVELAIPR